MSDGGTGEKTEEASPQKIKQARDKGQVSKSQDAIQALCFVGVFAATGLSLSWVTGELSTFLVKCFDAAARRGSEMPVVLSVVEEAMWVMLKSSLPALGAAFVMGLAGNYIQVGFMFTAEPLKPDVKKLNPVSGLKNMFSKKRLVEALKNILKFVAVSWIAYDAVEDQVRDVVLAARLDLWTGVDVGGRIIYDIAIRVGALFVIIASADFFFQRWQFMKEMMMSKYDVKQEYKQSEGDPHQKAERKALAEELILHGSQENVANADAVVVNPAHIAVAIKYDKEKGQAPKIVAKGLNKNAEKIKEIARAAGVPILRNVPLAQALSKLELDEEVPEELYEAVAEVLNFVYELKTKEDAKRRRGRPKPDDKDKKGAAGALPPGGQPPGPPNSPVKKRDDRNR